ncbi:MAG TPA: DUF3300 domain-containing protein [Phycisphaerae bacterium]
MLTGITLPLKAKAAALILTAAVAVGGTLGGVALVHKFVGPSTISASVPLPSAPPSPNYSPVNDPSQNSQNYSSAQPYASPQPAAPPTLTPVPVPSPAPYAQNSSATLGQQQLDQLLAPVALYPDPLIAEILPASTYPDELAAAALWLRYNPTPPDNAVDSQPWEPSIKALAHSPSVLVWMYNNPDWTHTLGTAFTYQSAQVMDSIQRLRGQAVAAGSLIDTPQQVVVMEDQQVCIEPVAADVLYVPVYDWRTCYTRRDSLTFYAGAHVGIWFDNDLDWNDHMVTVGARWDRGWDHRWDNDRNARTVAVHNNTTVVNNTVNKTTVNNITVNDTHNVKLGGTPWTRNDTKRAPVLPSNVKPSQPVRLKNTPPAPRPDARPAQPAERTGAQPNRPAPPASNTPVIAPRIGEERGAQPQERTPDRGAARDGEPVLPAPVIRETGRSAGGGGDAPPADGRGPDRGSGNTQDRPDRGNDGRGTGRGNGRGPNG